MNYSALVCWTCPSTIVKRCLSFSNLSFEGQTIKEVQANCVQANQDVGVMQWIFMWMPSPHPLVTSWNRFKVLTMAIMKGVKIAMWLKSPTKTTQPILSWLSERVGLKHLNSCMMNSLKLQWAMFQVLVILQVNLEGNGKVFQKMGIGMMQVWIWQWRPLKMAPNSKLQTRCGMCLSHY